MTSPPSLSPKTRKTPVAIPLVSHVDGSKSRPPVTTEPPARQNTRLRSVLFWCHLITGVTIGLVVAIMSVTGAAIAYEKQLLERAGSRFLVQPTAAAAARIPLDTLYDRVTSAPPGVKVTSLTLFADSTKPVTLGLESRQSLFIDPYTGRVLGNDGAVRSFMTLMTAWHRSLGIGGVTRSPVGTAITGVANLAFLFLIISGFFLWFPRQWSSRAFAAVIKFNPRVRSRARDWNWHHVLGFWSALPLFLIVLAGTFISYRWPGELLEAVAGSGVKADSSGGPGGAAGERGAGGSRGERGASGGARGERGMGGPRGERGRPAVGAPTGGPPMKLAAIGASFDTLTSLAAAQATGWRTIQVRLPRDSGGAVTVTAAMTVSSLPNERVQFSYDKKTGTLAAGYTASTTGNTGNAAKIRSWVRPVHTGEAGGFIGQTVAAIVSLAAAVLFWTGMALSWRRFKNRSARRMRAAARKEAAA